MSTYTKQTYRIGRIQMDPTYSGAGNTPSSIPVQSFIAASLLLNDLVPTDIKGASDWTVVAFDLLDANLTATNITAGGKTVTYPQLAVLLRQATLDRANAAGVS